MLGCGGVEMDVRNYLWSLTLVCVAAAVVKVATGEGAMKKHIDMICSLCVVCALVVPVFHDLSLYSSEDMGELFEYSGESEGREYYEEIYNSYLRSGSVELAETDLCGGLAKTLGVAQEDVSVSLVTEYTEDAAGVSEAVVELGSGAYFADPEIIKEYIMSRLGTECRIIYKNKDE